MAPALRVIDMCCGAGNLACAIAVHAPGVRVWASDLTDGCVSWTKRNVEQLGLGERVEVYQGDLFASLADKGLEGTVDIVVCNPPYISSGRLAGDRAELLENEPREAFDGGPYGLNIHQRVMADAPRFLKPGGWLLMEFGLGQHRQVKILLERSDQFETRRARRRCRRQSARRRRPAQELTQSTDEREIGVRRRIGDADFDERVVALAAFAAETAVLRHRSCRSLCRSPDRVHTGQRQLERHAERHAAADDVGFAEIGVRGVDLQAMVETERQRRGHRGAKARSGVRKRVVAERPHDDAIDAGRGTEDPRLAQQNDVASRQIDRFVRGVVTGRMSGHGPVCGRIDIAHVDRQHDQRADAFFDAGDRGEQCLNRVTLSRFPRQSD